MNEQELEAFAFETITVSSAAIGFTLATWANPTSGGAARMALVTLETNPARWRADGTDPTASVGHLLGAGDGLKVWGGYDLTSIRFIATGSDATARVTYYR